MARAPAAHRPHYLPTERLAILELRAARVVKYYRLRAVLILLAIGCGLIALARPQWGAYQTIVQSKGVDRVTGCRNINMKVTAGCHNPDTNFTIGSYDHF